VVDNAE